MSIKDYQFSIRHLSKEDGGGFLIEFPDLPGCISDGDTIEEAIENGFEAVKAWIKTARHQGRTVPEPNYKDNYSGKWVQRVPKTIHARLATLAKAEGVSLNSLVTSMISEVLGNKHLSRH